MSRHTLKDPETWLPPWLRGRGIKVEKIRVKNKDGSTTELQANVQGKWSGTVTDQRASRHMTADPRFTND